MHLYTQYTPEHVLTHTSLYNKYKKVHHLLSSKLTHEEIENLNIPILSNEFHQ